jgi:long-chain fatty acid transport protein
MQLNKRNRLTTAIVTLLVTTPLWATNGYFTHGTGTKNKGMAGAGMAMPEDAISIANNPAAAVANAGKYDLGLAVFVPDRYYETTESQLNGQMGAFTIGPTRQRSTNKFFYIPHMAGSWGLSDKSAIAAAFYGRGGMNTTWNWGTATFSPQPGMDPMTFQGTYGSGMFGDSGKAGVDLMQAFLDVGYAHTFGDNFTLGISAVGVMQLFSARGVMTFAPYTETFAASGGMTMPDSLSNNSHDTSYGLGVKLGLQWDITDMFAVAASYAPKISMSKLKDYSDLFADGGNMDIPSDWKVGFTLRPSERFALNFDVEGIGYSDVPSVGNPFSNLFNCPTANPMATDTSNCLGGKNGAGFGWEDMTIYKIGGQWSSGNDWTWRAGYSHGDQPIPESEMIFNILAPGVMEDHLTLGFTKGLASGNEYSMSFMYAFKNEISGPNALDPTQMIYLEMKQWEIEFAFGWR